LDFWFENIPSGNTGVGWGTRKYCEPQLTEKLIGRHCCDYRLSVYYATYDQNGDIKTDPGFHAERERGQAKDVLTSLSLRRHLDNGFGLALTAWTSGHVFACGVMGREIESQWGIGWSFIKKVLGVKLAL
jgi:hypothetical protein